MGRRAKSADKSAPQRVAANVIRERRSLIRDRNTLMRLSDNRFTLFRTHSCRALKNDAAHGLIVSPPNRDKLTMRINSLKTLNLILSLSKDEAKILGFYGRLPRRTCS